MSGNVWMFSDEIDDEDLEFMSHDYVTYNMACEYYRLGMKPVIRMAHEAGAVYKRERCHNCRKGQSHCRAYGQGYIIRIFCRKAEYAVCGI